MELVQVLIDKGSFDDIFLLVIFILMIVIFDVLAFVVVIIVEVPHPMSVLAFLAAIYAQSSEIESTKGHFDRLSLHMVIK